MIPQFVVTAFLLLFIIKLFQNLYNSSTSKNLQIPWKLPILGHLPLLGQFPHETLLEWKAKYGPIIFVYFGMKPAIVINDGPLITAAFNLPSLSGRPKINYFDDFTMERSGFALSDGPKAKEIRSFIQHKFKELGFGSHLMEAKIQELIPDLLEIFQGHLKKPLQIQHAFAAVTLKYLWSLINAIEGGDETGFKEFSENLAKLVAIPPLLGLSLFVPQLACWFPGLTGYDKRRHMFKAMEDYVQQHVASHEGTRVKNLPRDLIDEFLDAKFTSPQIYTQRTIVATVLEILTGGNDTTCNTLEWLIYYLVKNPQVQDKIREEIHQNIGANREARFSDRRNLPFCDAVLLETLRITSVVPLSLFHSALEDTKFQGWQVKKGTMVVGNLYAAHRDPSIWENPSMFNPDRFLGEDGKLNGLKSRVLAFGTGKRNCIGDYLARNQIFLFMVNIVQRYKLQSIGVLPTDSGIPGITRICKPYLVGVSRRS